MPGQPLSRHDREIAAIARDLDAIALATALIRIERILERAYRPDQPRAPAGGSDGGRWVGDGGGADPDATGALGMDTTAASRTEETVTEDGSRVLSIRIRADRRAEWDEQHTVTAPDGTRTLFETSGLTQTVRDGDTGEILGKSTLTPDGAVSEAFVQPARAGRTNPARVIWRGIEAAGALLYGVLGMRDGDDRKAVFAAPASEYVPGEGADARAIWVGRIEQIELDRLCLRNQEIQALADGTAAEVRASGDYKSAQDFGNKVHKIIGERIDALNDPNLVAERSYDSATGEDARRGEKGSLRLDALERARPAMVCVYDHKTGEADLRPTRSVDIITAIQKHFGPGYR